MDTLIGPSSLFMFFPVTSCHTGAKARHSGVESASRSSMAPDDRERVTHRGSWISTEGLADESGSVDIPEPRVTRT